MRELAPDVSQLSQLSRLDLSFNRLSDLPASLSQLRGSLVALGLTCNTLDVLPPVVTSLTALTRLDVAGQCTLQYEQGGSHASSLVLPHCSGPGQNHAHRTWHEACR
jgi:hypothetical protein